MRLLLDDTSNRASDSGLSAEQTDQQIFDDSYNSNLPPGGAPSVFEDSEYDSPNAGNYSDPEFRAQLEARRRGGLIAQAKKGINQAKAKAFRTAPKKLGSALGDKQMFMDDTPESREQAKKAARKKVKNFASDKIGKKIADKGIKKGFQKGLEEGAGKVAKEGAKKAGKAVAKGAGKAVGKVGAKGATALTVEGGIAATGAVTGAATFGLGFILSILLDIAISLGINDAVDAGFELAAGNIRHATFLAIRAATKVGVLIYILLTMGFLVSIGGIFIGVPMLILLNIYMILGLIFKKTAIFQGLVWWEIAIIVVFDLFAFIIIVAFLGGLAWWLCNEAGLGSGGIQGAVAGAIASVYDWWNKSTAGSVAADFCKYVQQGGGDFGGGGAGGGF